VKSPSARRRHPAALLAVILVALVATGALYTVLAPQPRAAESTQASPVQQGHDLFLANCSTCHGMNGEGAATGPSLVGVGAAAVDFQVGTGRMPAYTYDVQQVPKARRVLFSQAEIDQMAAYVASLGPGPSIPSPSDYDTAGVSAQDIADGGQIFRTNCAMCHNAIGAGGALTAGKYAPSLKGVSSKHIFEAMETGPQSMPVFGQTIPSQDKTKVVAYLKSLEDKPQYGGLGLGKVGPLTEGLVAWLVGLGALVAFAVWLGQKSS
jgi:ubiquinol-cytochrome c reductase cytochrome c subunit